MRRQNGWSLKLFVVLAMLGWLMPALSQAGKGEALPKIGPAPEFTLTTQDGQRLSLQELRGKVVAVTFIYTGCADTCPLLTAKLVRLQTRFGAEFGTKVFFVADSSTSRSKLRVSTNPSSWPI